MQEMFTEVTTQADGAQKRMLRWPVIAASALVWFAIGMMAYQSYGDRITAEKRSYGHLQDVASQLLEHVELYFEENQQLTEAVLDRLDHPDPGCKPICDDVLYRAQRRYNKMVPGLELLVLDAQSKPIASTQRDIAAKLELLPELLKKINNKERTVILIGHDIVGTPSFIIGQGHYDRNNQLQAYIVATEPLSNLLREVNISALGSQGLISLVSADSKLLDRRPVLGLVKFGTSIKGLDETQLGRFPSSFISTSPLDSVKRLLVKRTVSYGAAKGELTIYLGIGVEEYLSEWTFSAGINLFLSLLLLVMWIYGLKASKHARALHNDLESSIESTRRILEEMPLPVLLINAGSNTIEQYNRAAIDLFGSVADRGQAIQSLFADEATWAKWPKDSPKYEGRLLSRKGPSHFELHRTWIKGTVGKTTQHWLLTMVDVSETHKQTTQLQHAATTDTLTAWPIDAIFPTTQSN